MSSTPKSLRALRKETEPHADYGFFGPDSVTWKVWLHPTSFMVGFQRSVTIEQLDPNLIAAVEKSGGVRYRPHTRYDRTLRYFALVAFGPTEPAVRASDVLVKVHSKAIGHDPVTGGTYDANRPDSQLWIHMTAWHSILYCYEKFGPGRLTPEEEAQYWEECARAAELQTIDPDTVPRSRDAVRAYFEDWRPRLAASEAAQSMTDFILHTEVAFPPDRPKGADVVMLPFARLVGAATVSTYPAYIQKMFGLRQSRVTAAAVRVVMKGVVAAMHRSPQLYVAAAGFISPSTVPIVAPLVLGLEPLNPVVLSPREAQRKYGVDNPADAHLDMRAKQYDKVFGRGEAPSDDGLLESQAHFGPLEAGRTSQPA